MLDCLNDDCLTEIFQYLNVKEQLIMTAVSESFRILIVDRFWRLKFHKFKTPFMVGCNELTLAEFQMFYRLLAPHITELYMDHTPNTNIAFTSYLGRYTKRPNLEFYIHFEHPQLRSLFCNDEHFYNGYLKVMARKCPKLEMLQLVSRYVTGQYLVDMTNLRELSIYSLRLEPIYFKQLFNKQKVLRVHLSGETTNITEMSNVLNTILPKITELRYFDEHTQLLADDLFTKSALLFKNLEILYCNYLSEFVYSLHRLKELHVGKDLNLISLLKLVKNNVHLDQLYLGQEFSMDRKFRDWMCELSDCVHGQQHESVLNVYLNATQEVVQQLKQVIEEHDLQHSYLKPSIDVKSLTNKTFEEFPILYLTLGIGFTLKWE